MARTVTIERKCINCGQPLTREKLKLSRPFFAFLSLDSYEYNITVASIQDLETRKKPCIPGFRHTFDRQDYLSIDF